MINRKKKIVGFTLYPETIEKLRKMANAMHVSMSEFLESIIEDVWVKVNLGGEKNEYRV